jgi:hypothetical protein
MLEVGKDVLNRNLLTRRNETLSRTPHLKATRRQLTRGLAMRMLGILLLLTFPNALPARDTKVQSPAPLDGLGRPVEDPLLDKLAGEWVTTRMIRNKSETNNVKAEWVLNHQFLRLHYQDVQKPSRYEAMAFIGYDNTSERYVMHWIDVYGGRFSETLGYGVRSENSIRFVFEYPDGPFHNTLTFDAKAGTWISIMEQKNAAGVWTRFAEDHFRPR